MTFDQFRGRSGAQPQESQCGCDDQVSQPTYHNINEQAMQCLVADSQNLQGPPTGHCEERAPERETPTNSGPDCAPPSTYDCVPTAGPTIINNYYFGNNNVYATQQGAAPSGEYCPPPSRENCAPPAVEQSSNLQLPTYPNYFQRPMQDCGPSDRQPSQPTNTTQPTETTHPSRHRQPVETTQPSQPSQPSQPTEPVQPTQPVETTNPPTTPTTSDAQGYSKSISGSFPPDYLADRYPNGGVPSWDNNYNGSATSSPLDNPGSIKYSQTYSETPNYYSGANGQPGYYNTSTWNKYNSKGTRYGGS